MGSDNGRDDASRCCAHDPSFSTINRKMHSGSFVPTGLFVLGYIATWTGFSFFITLLQNMLHHAALLSPMMESTNPVLGGIIFTAAGIYQWTPLKQARLKRCRSPLGFILFRWRKGLRGALFMGLEHGVYCMGCCLDPFQSREEQLAAADASSIRCSAYSLRMHRADLRRRWRC